MLLKDERHTPFLLFIRERRAITVPLPFVYSWHDSDRQYPRDREEEAAGDLTKNNNALTSLNIPLMTVLNA